jgi:hypothetical protein
MADSTSAKNTVPNDIQQPTMTKLLMFGDDILMSLE